MYFPVITKILKMGVKKPFSSLKYKELLCNFAKFL